MSTEESLRQRLAALADEWDQLDGPLHEKRLCWALAGELRDVLRQPEGAA